MPKKPVSPYVQRAWERMNQCHCGRGPKKAETELCSQCEQEGKEAGFVDLQFERVVRVTEGER